MKIKSLLFLKKNLRSKFLLKASTIYTDWVLNIGLTTQTLKDDESQKTKDGASGQNDGMNTESSEKPESMEEGETRPKEHSDIVDFKQQEDTNLNEARQNLSKDKNKDRPINRNNQ